MQVKYPEDPEAVRSAEMYKVILQKVENRQAPLHENGHTRWDRIYPTVEGSRLGRSRFDVQRIQVEWDTLLG